MFYQSLHILVIGDMEMLQANQDQFQLDTDLDDNGDKEDDNQELESRHVLIHHAF